MTEKIYIDIIEPPGPIEIEIRQTVKSSIELYEEAHKSMQSIHLVDSPG